ncbi:MAG: GNAT family N-acetyltransferase [Clostridia bacterium]
MKDIIFVKQQLSDKENSNKYLLKTELTELGYAYIFHGNSTNNVYFFIHPEHRSNGFGYLIFSHILKELKNITKYPHITLDIEKSNPHANNIIAKSGGLILSDDTHTHWILKL